MVRTQFLMCESMQLKLGGFRYYEHLRQRLSWVPKLDGFGLYEYKRVKLH